MLEETLIKWREQAFQEGRREGRLEGRLEERLEVLRDLMVQRFGRLPKTVQRRLDDITSIEEVQRLTRKVLKAASLQEMGLEKTRPSQKGKS